MRTLKLIVLLTVVAVTLCNCFKNDNIFNDVDFDQMYQHDLLLSFQDVWDYDLVKGIEYDYGEIDGVQYEWWGWVKRDLYTLEVLYPDEIKNPVKPDSPLYTKYENRYLGLIKDWATGYDYLRLTTPSYRAYYDSHSNRYIAVPFVEKITFRLTCHYLFGDDVAHDIVTWWELYEEEGFIPTPICYRIEIDGKEYSVGESQIATIVL